MEKYFFIAVVCVVCNPSFAINSDLIGSQVDVSGKIIVSVYERMAGDPLQRFTDFSVEVAPDEIAIGGGVGRLRVSSGTSAYGVVPQQWPNSMAGIDKRPPYARSGAHQGLRDRPQNIWIDTQPIAVVHPGVCKHKCKRESP